jgi:Nucleotidyl transferase
MGRVTSGPNLVVLAGGLAKRYGGCKPLAPVGVHGEAVIDLTVSDALRAGFRAVVVVVGPQTAPAIEYHARRCWPSWVGASFTVQPVPLGTAHALLCARRLLPPGPFGVVNADDVYGVPAMEVLAEHLERDADPDGGGGGGQHLLVAFALRDTVATDKPVTRGICKVGADGELVGIVERRKVTMDAGGRFSSDDGLEPAEIDATEQVSVNLWGFSTSIWEVLASAVAATHEGVGPDGSIADGAGVDDEMEVLLPEVVNDLVSGRAPGTQRLGRVMVLHGPGRCLGVTHADDLPVVRAELAAMVGQGIRPEGIWEAPPARARVP